MLENSVIGIGKAASISLKFDLLELKSSKAGINYEMSQWIPYSFGFALIKIFNPKLSLKLVHSGHMIILMIINVVHLKTSLNDFNIEGGH